MLADWAESATPIFVHLFGSRVRGDHRPDSDVDSFVDIEGPEPEPRFPGASKQSGAWSSLGLPGTPRRANAPIAVVLKAMLLISPSRHCQTLSGGEAHCAHFVGALPHWPLA